MDISIYGKTYKDLTIEIWNNSISEPSTVLNIEKIVKRVFIQNKPQRVQLGIKELSSMFEVILTPINNDWNTMRLTGTNPEYTLVSVIGFGCYAFNIKKHAITQGSGINAGYIKEKLGLDLLSSIGLECFFLLLNEEYGNQTLSKKMDNILKKINS